MITVASVPANHPYVQAIVDPQSVVLLDDPTPVGIEDPVQWWPPRWLEPGYISAHIDEIELLHVHFGFEGIPTADLVQVCHVLDRHRVPLVVTVHDLHNPHVADVQVQYDRLDVLLSAATEIITLTDGARDAIAARWGRDAEVMPHPHLLPLEVFTPVRLLRAAPVVAIHAKALRANVDPWPLLDALLGVQDGSWRLRLDLDEDALASHRGGDELRLRLARLHAAGVDVRIHPPFADDELIEYLGQIDVLVLPYRFGTHSGWVELCHDAGVGTVVPDCGFFAEQHASASFAYNADHLDAEALHHAVVGVLRQRVSDDTAERRRARRGQQRCEVRHGLVQIYRRAIVTKKAAVRDANGQQVSA